MAVLDHRCARRPRRDPPATRAGGPRLAALLAALALGCLACGEARPNVLIVVLDTVRADRMSCYGYPLPTTPRIDAFARDALLFERVVATSNWTVPSHASMFTGLHTDVHGAVGDRAWLDDGFETLAERLAAVGYETWLFGANPFVSSRHNLTQGFATTHHPWQPRWIERVRADFEARHAVRAPGAGGSVPTKESGQVIREAFGQWLEQRDPGPSFFASST